MASTREKHIAVLEELLARLQKLPSGGTHEPKTSPGHLIAMIAMIKHDPMPDDKIARWTGFIQGVMAANGWLDVDAERERTRPIFAQQ